MSEQTIFETHGLLVTTERLQSKTGTFALGHVSGAFVEAKYDDVVALSIVGALIVGSAAVYAYQPSGMMWRALLEMRQLFYVDLQIVASIGALLAAVIMFALVKKGHHVIVLVNGTKVPVFRARKPEEAARVRDAILTAMSTRGAA